MSIWRETPTLAGRYVTLRPLERADRDSLIDAFAGLAYKVTTAVPNADTIDAWYDMLDRERAAGRVLPFTVLDADGVVVGATRYLRMTEAHRRVEIGGTLYTPRVQRTGLNTEAKRLLLAHAFDVLGCQCVQFRTNWLNRESRQAIERLGAKMDGVLRGHILTAQGDPRDTVVYSILAHEWPHIRCNLDSMLARYA